MRLFSIYKPSEIGSAFSQKKKKSGSAIMQRGVELFIELLIT
jgi:hypothetical protein